MTKRFLIYLLFLLTGYVTVAQNNFVGIAKYKMTVEGSANVATDSMLVIFGKEKIRLVFYLPDSKNPGKIAEKVYIDNLTAKKSLALNENNRTYKSDTLISEGRFNFTNSNSITASNNILCFRYNADSAALDRSLLASAYCLASIDYRNEQMTNYFFLGIQPLIVDNRLVMDFVVARADGGKQRIYICDIKRMDNVDAYFELDEYSAE